MKYSKSFIVLMMILSLFSIAFVGKESIKRFLPIISIYDYNSKSS